MLNRLSLRYSIPLLLLLFATLSQLVMVSLHIPRYERETEAAWRQHAAQLLAVMQGTLNDQLRQGHQEALGSTLSDLSSLAGVHWAAIVDRNLQPQVSSRLDLQLDQHSELPGLLLTGVPNWLPVSEHHYLAVYPLRAGGNLSAQPGHALLVDWDFNPMVRAQLREAWLQQAELPVLMLVLGILLVYLYNRLVTNRLAALGCVTSQFAAGDVQVRASTDGHDEISLLAGQLNSMIGQIEYDRRALRRNEQLLRSLIEAAPVGMLILDEDGSTDAANPAAAQLFGCSQQELAGQQISSLLGSVELWPQLLGQPNQSQEISIERKAGELHLEVSCTPFQRNGHPQFLLLMRDISDRKQAEKRLHYMAHFDPLTDVANRNQLLHQLRQLPEETPQALLFLDLDHFKRINDTLGHDIGDELLRAVAGRLRQMVPEEALLARLGGDEFVILLTGAEAGQASPLAEQLLESFRDPFEVGQYELYTTPSIGITHHRHGQVSPRQLLKEADLALYQAKNRGRNCTAHFDFQLAEEAEHRRQLEDELRSALLGDQFELYYQPQLGLDGRVHTFEALLRWHSPKRGMVSPAQFLPALEESGLIIEATQWVFRQACRQLHQWRAEGHDWRVAINLSPLDFRQNDLAGNLCHILAEEQVPGSALELEITESALLDADHHVIKTLRLLKARGMTLFLDDFGTGYASLAYLQQFPLDGVKIDQQFVRGLPDDRHSRALVSGILVMADQLGIEVVAEGIETEAQAGYLRERSCQRLQGFLFSRPLPAEQAATLARSLH